MPRPIVAPITDQLYAALEPLTRSDEGLDWPLLRFLDATITGLPVNQIDGYVRDRDEYPGWTITLDPDKASAEVLAWQAQFSGTKLEPALSDAQKRAKIKAKEGWQRGTLAALIAAVKRTLTGTQTVIVEERTNGSVAGAWKLRVRTYALETPDPAKTQAAILSQKPLGIVLAYAAVTGQSYSDVLAGEGTYTVVNSTYASYDAMRQTPP